MIRKVLIANRGEIALRIIRTCKEMGIETVIVYSDADKNSLPVKLADKAFHIGPPLAKKSYLNIEKIINIAIETNSEAIHPGYGFLAENALFAEVCQKNEIIFIGPSAETHRIVGEKIKSRKVAKELGIPITPGSEEAISCLDDALETAKEIGFPVIIKASGGGGGRGMKLVKSERDLENELNTARGEAAASFKNSEIFIEKYIESPRHIEIQIIGDRFGNYIHLGERECSIQKRYQKLIEESPSIFIDDTLRKKITEAAIRIMSSIGYVNAGTVEFLVDENKNFYFNEINSRLQVEHPVTEMVTGIDLVKEQLIIAGGERIRYKQEEIHPRGWAIECRINAEDPNNGFMPSPGIVSQIIQPGGFGVRVDTHLFPQYEIPPFYDSLVGKLIVWGEDRRSTVCRMRRALEEFFIDGVKTTIPFLKKVMEDKDFIEGVYNTHFLEKFNLGRS